LKKKKLERGLEARELKAQGHHRRSSFKKLDSKNPSSWKMPPGADFLPLGLQECGRNMTPTCIKALYDIPNAYIKDDVNMMGLFESGDIYSQDDLNAFFAAYAPHVPQGTHPLLNSIDGGQAPVANGSGFNTGESDLDMDLAFSLIYVSLLTVC
jgi:tripeptidyl-peptidase-1